MKQYDVYLFDWDGTLGKSLEMWLDVMRTQFDRYGVKNLSDDEIAKIFGVNFTTAGANHGIPPEKLPDFMSDIQADAHKRSLTVEMYEGALAVLERLSNEGKKLALITSNWKPSVMMMLENHNLSKMFDVVITGDDVAAYKPDPEGILSALKTLGAKKSRTVMIGDTDHDMGAAKSAGVDRILFFPPSHQLFYDLKKLKKHGPSRVIASWEEL